MWIDPIVEEIRQIRREHAARFGYDIKAIFDDLRRGQEEERKKGRRIISRPSKTRRKVATASKGPRKRKS
ncbi:MAG: hypothetical protein HUU46_14025 [Candidatus Hydrogenedentes bacterium]|nr:hypothetical protein [Candidatus Hydrogenedentota bacterium]